MTKTIRRDPGRKTGAGMKSFSDDIEAVGAFDWDGLAKPFTLALQRIIMAVCTLVMREERVGKSLHLLRAVIALSGGRPTGITSSRCRIDSTTPRGISCLAVGDAMALLEI